MNKKLYYIQSPYSCCGNCISFWAIDGKGYTCNLDKAWKVTEEKAKSILRDKRGDIAYSVEDVNKIAVRHADFQLLRDYKCLI